MSVFPLYSQSNKTAITHIEAATDTVRSADTSIRSFNIHVPQASLDDLRRRIAATKWPERETLMDASQGVQLATIRKLASYWKNEYDWRACEAKLNALPQFVTNIDGLDIHFIHVRSKNPNALPLIITHGWPGSIIEQQKIVGPLTDPTAYGGNAEDSFDIVIPSLPGYGFSGKPTTTGWDIPHIARAWVTLMNRLGYTRFVAAGGDVGAQVGDELGVEAPHGLLGIHSNMPGTVPANVSTALNFHEPPPDGLSPGEKHAWDQLDFFYKKGLGYAEAVLASGARLVATARDPRRLDDVLKEYGDQVRTALLDGADENAANSAVQAAVDAFGRLDVVVNNAGYGDIAPFEQLSSERFRAVVDTNFYDVGVFRRSAVSWS
jgi:pimeloyl-ACP methyl ester carboxylesterase